MKKNMVMAYGCALSCLTELTSFAMFHPSILSETHSLTLPWFPSVGRKIKGIFILRLFSKKRKAKKREEKISFVFEKEEK